MNRRFQKEVIYVDTTARQPLVYREKRVPAEVKLYEETAEGLKSLDGPTETKDGFPIYWKNDPSRTPVEKKADYLYWLRIFNGRRAHTAEYLGIPLNTVHWWIKTDEGFRENLESVKELIDDDKRKLKDHLVYEKEDREFLKMELQTLPEYNRARETRVNVSGTVQHDHALLRDMSNDDKKQLFRDALEAVDADYEEVKAGD